MNDDDKNFHFNIERAIMLTVSKSTDELTERIDAATKKAGEAKWFVEMACVLLALILWRVW